MSKLERDLTAMREADPLQEPDLRRIRAALRRKSGLLVGAAADRLREAEHRGLEAELVRAFHVLCERPVDRDPGCTGKYGLIRALDALDWHQEEVFIAGARWVQPEPSWGPPVDTAASVRSQSAFALVRLGWPETPALLADLLVDPLPPVRASASRAVVAWGDPMGAALLRLKLHAGDEDPVVLTEILTDLVELDAASGLDLARAWLSRDADHRESAALALGATRQPEAIPLLLDALERSYDHHERRTLLVSVGTLRIEPAREALLERLGGPDWEMVLEALGPFRFDPSTLELALERAPRRAEAIRAVLAGEG